MEKSQAVGIFAGKSISGGFVFVVIFVAFALYYISFASIDCPLLTAQTDHHSSNNYSSSETSIVDRSNSSSADECQGKYVYVYDLPPEFNKGLLESCESLSSWADFCLYLSNEGFGPRVGGGNKSSKGVFSGGRRGRKGWYRTNQFSLEVIFHSRMRRYECLTGDPALASAVFVPYYAGLDVGRHLWGGFDRAARDAPAERLAAWLRGRPEWGRASGWDHFFVGGRVAWDFRRPPGGDWGSRLMLLRGPANMTMLTIEASSGEGAGSNEFAVPYPTYFHPSSSREVAEWQRKMRSVCPPRDGPATVRGEIIRQCESSPEHCELLRCDSPETDCDDPRSVMAVLSNSVFCLQPPGDSYTRRSAFDSVLAGCVPVFFHNGSAYDQYRWHFPADREKYSVYIPEAGVKEGKVSIGEALRRIPEGAVAAMREEVIEMIPSVVYADPKAKEKGFEDAFDIAVKNVIQRVKVLEDGTEISSPITTVH